jgi:hypothetical protein
MQWQNCAGIYKFTQIISLKNMKYFLIQVVILSLTCETKIQRYEYIRLKGNKYYSPTNVAIITTWTELYFHESWYEYRNNPAILSAFAKLRKATIGFIISVRPSFRMEQLGSR